MNEETLKRIEDDANISVGNDYSVDYEFEKYYEKGFIAGAISERNKVLEEITSCASFISDENYIIPISVIESLKIPTK